MSNRFKINPKEFHEMKTILRKYKKSTGGKNVKKLENRFNVIRFEEEYIKLFNEDTEEIGSVGDVEEIEFVEDTGEIGDSIDYRRAFKNEKGKNKFIDAVIVPILGTLDNLGL